MRYVDVTPEAGKRFFANPPEGPVVMLNLIRLRETADYSATPGLAPSSSISGREAYARYAAHSEPFLAEAGSEVLFSGNGTDCLIGPFEERWDLVLLVRHASVQAFLAFASNEAYLKGIGHRTAAVEDYVSCPSCRPTSASPSSTRSRVPVGIPDTSALSGA